MAKGIFAAMNDILTNIPYIWVRTLECPNASRPMTCGLLEVANTEDKTSVTILVVPITCQMSNVTKSKCRSSCGECLLDRLWKAQMRDLWTVRTRNYLLEHIRSVSLNFKWPAVHEWKPNTTMKLIIAGEKKMQMMVTFRRRKLHQLSIRGGKLKFL